MKYDIQTIGREFEVFGEYLDAVPFGAGHINDTYAARYDQGGQEIRYIHQRINHTVFPNPEQQMENIERVTQHLHNKLNCSPHHHTTREALTVVPTRQGNLFFRSPEGDYWRTYVLIENTHCVDIADSPALAHEAGLAFGRFQALLDDYEGPRLFETIPGFHHTPLRIQALHRAIKSDPLGRLDSVREEIEFILDRESKAGELIELWESGQLPERIVHNDTKINNVLFDSETGEGLCVVDLDTVMPGLAAFDFGDMVRTVTSPAAEDEPDASNVRMRFPYFEALARGYLAGTGSILTREEVDSLVMGGRIIPLTIGIRFLTDFLEGDRYFKTHYETHNRVRCRTQLALVASIEAQEENMQTVLHGLYDEILKGNESCVL